MSLSVSQIVVGLMGCWASGFALGQVIRWVKAIRNIA